MRISVLAVLAGFLLVAPPAYAGRGSVQPLDRILSHLRAERGGTFYDAQGPFDDGHGHMHYRIKWLTPDGRLIWLDTDARTGRVLGVDNGDFHGRRAVPHGRNRERFDNDRRRSDDYDHQPREDFPRDPRWPRWDNGTPVGGGYWQRRDDGRWHNRGRGNGRWRDNDDDDDGGGHRRHHRY